MVYDLLADLEEFFGSIAAPQAGLGLSLLKPMLGRESELVPVGGWEALLFGVVFLVLRFLEICQYAW
jgi:hypothetical protein